VLRIEVEHDAVTELLINEQLIGLDDARTGRHWRLKCNCLLVAEPLAPGYLPRAALGGAVTLWTTRGGFALGRPIFLGKENTM
jgi:hypothetical protein